LYNETSAGYSFYLPSPDGQRFAAYQTDGKQSIRDSASGQLIADLSRPITGTAFSGKASWSPDGHYLAIPYFLQTTSQDQRLILEQIIRAWRVEPGQPPQVAGDLFVPGSTDNYSISPVDWDTQAGVAALLFKFGANGIGRWNVTHPTPSLEEQRRTVAQQIGPSAGTYNASVYFQLIGRISVWSNLGGVQVWFPDHHRLVNADASRYAIQELIPLDAPLDLAKEKGLPFDPQPPNQLDQDQSGPDLAVSPDARMVAVGLQTGLLNLYDAATGKLFNSFTAHQGRILSLNFSPDGRYLATCGSDRAVKVWDTKSWRPLAVLRLSNAEAASLAWLPDNRTLVVVSSSQGGTLLWRWQ
jgi:WD40 repeat protein